MFTEKEFVLMALVEWRNKMRRDMYKDNGEKKLVDSKIVYCTCVQVEGVWYVCPLHWPLVKKGHGDKAVPPTPPAGTAATP